MSVPFLTSVAMGAVEALTEPALIAKGGQATARALELRFPEEHPLLVQEHLHYGRLLVGAALALGEQVQAGTLARPQAVAQLHASYLDFPVESIERALDYSLRCI